MSHIFKTQLTSLPPTSSLKPDLDTVFLKVSLIFFFPSLIPYTDSIDNLYMPEFKVYFESDYFLPLLPLLPTLLISILWIIVVAFLIVSLLPLSTHLKTILNTAAAAKSLQSCPTLCDPINGSPPGSPWDSPGRNTWVGCHFLLQCMKVKSESEVAQSRPTLPYPMDCSLPGLLHPWDFPGKSTVVGCHCLFLLNTAVSGILFKRRISHGIHSF